jgi:hypothetical protein
MIRRENTHKRERGFNRRKLRERRREEQIFSFREEIAAAGVQ